MKTLKFMAVMAIIALTTVSCVEKSAKYQALLSQRDSLQSQVQAVETNYNQTLDILNDVEQGFASISETETQMKVDMKGIEGQNLSKKQLLAAQMEQIKKTLENNKAKLEKLQRVIGKSAKENKFLAETIKRMETELAEKTASIAALQSELAQKNIKIEELTGSVNKLTTNVAQLSDESNQQKATIRNQDETMNKVWYCVSTTKELIEAQVLNSNGFLRAKTVMDREFNKAGFTQADLRTLKSIPTNSKSAKILSNHPKDSYNLTKGADKLITIEITNPEKFWSVSKYLVIKK